MLGLDRRARSRAGAPSSIRSSAHHGAPPSASASARSRSLRRATRTSFEPGSRASRRAVASPIPLDAPVMRANAHPASPPHQLASLPRHARAGARRGRTRNPLGPLAHVGLDMRVEAQRAVAAQLAAGGHGVDEHDPVDRVGREVDDEHIGELDLGPRLVLLAGKRDLVARALQHRQDLRTEQEVRDEGDDASQGMSYWAWSRRNCSRIDSGRPHIGSTSTRPLRTSRTASSPSIPASSSNLRVPWTAGAAARRGRSDGRPARASASRGASRAAR